MITSSTVLVGTSPTLLAVGAGTGGNKTQVTICYRSGSIVTLGPSDVVAGEGLAITAAAGPYVFEIGSGDSLYGIVSTDSAKVQILTTTDL